MRPQPLQIVVVCPVAEYYRSGETCVLQQLLCGTPPTKKLWPTSARALHKTPPVKHLGARRGAGFSSHACAFIINLSLNPFVTEHPVYLIFDRFWRRIFMAAPSEQTWKLHSPVSDHSTSPSSAENPLDWTCEELKGRATAVFFPLNDGEILVQEGSLGSECVFV